LIRNNQAGVAPQMKPQPRTACPPDPATAEGTRSPTPVETQKDNKKKKESVKVLQSETKKTPNVKDKDHDSRKKIKTVSWIGTSLSKSLDRRKFEKDTNTKLKFVKAFGIKNESDQLYPDMNFTDTVPKVVEQEKPDMLVLQTGSIEISNINVKSALMD
jgi:hypothetical protein